MNKKHYPATSKFFKVKLVTWFQHYGAKVHFNYIPVPNAHVRYSVQDSLFRLAEQAI